MADSSISIANEKVSITTVCQMLGMFVPELYYLSSLKLHCPFGDVSHADGGQARAFRVYPEDNTAFCFACGIFFTPVRLLAMARDLSVEEAAEVLLEEAGYQPEDPDDRWALLLQSTEEPVSQLELAEALKIFCARVDPSWEERQFDTAIAVRFQQCLDLLSGVKNGADSKKWLAGTKQVMITILGEPRAHQIA